jgi:hypothetical protein
MVMMGNLPALKVNGMRHAPEHSLEGQSTHRAQCTRPPVPALPAGDFS